VIVLVLGGARSGKSAYAERRAAALAGDGSVTVVVTAEVGDDHDLAARVAAHRARRPPGWTTVEAGAALVASLAATSGVALVDALGPWLAATPEFAPDSAGLCGALRRRRGDTVVVSEEVGLGVHPSSEAGRRFRDALGEMNQAVAAVADEAVLVVAGRAVRLDPRTAG
jgi:adenosyl cobinamide kinase/adenosyl cobinamide phosphate guanylyltransferase